MEATRARSLLCHQHHSTRGATPTRRRHQSRGRPTPTDLRVGAFHSLFHAAAAAAAPVRRNGLTVHVDVDCFKADTSWPGWTDHEREVQMEGMAA